MSQTFKAINQILSIMNLSLLQITFRKKKKKLTRKLTEFTSKD